MKYEEMTTDDLDKEVAVKVMSYTQTNMENWLESGAHVFDKQDWKPTKDMNQAMMCGDKHKGDFVSICNTPMGWTIICGRDLYLVVDTLEEVPKAIVISCLKNWDKLQEVRG